MIKYKTLLSAFLLLVLTLVVHGSALNAWWRGDDPYLIVHALKYGPFQTFYVPEVAQTHHPGFVTPWYIFSFSVDAKLFGLNAHMFYLHNLFSIWITSVLIFVLITFWLPMQSALIGSIIFLVGHPTSEVVQAIMTRHYIEGLLFSLLGFSLLVQSVRKGGKLFPLLAGSCWAIAVSSKEIFIPLPLLFLLFTDGTFRDRLRVLLPTLLILVIYPLWRYYLLGHLMGGYPGWQSSFSFNMLKSTLIDLPSIFFGRGTTSIIGGIIVLFFAAMAIIRNKRALLLIISTLAAIIIPLIPLIGEGRLSYAGYVFYRYFLLIWASLAILVSFGFYAAMDCLFLRRIFQVSGICLLSILFTFAVIKTNSEKKQGMTAQLRASEQIYSYWYNNDSTHYFYVDPFARDYFIYAYSTISELKYLSLGVKEIPKLLKTEQELKNHNCSQHPQLFAYDFSEMKLRNICP